MRPVVRINFQKWPFKKKVWNIVGFFGPYQSFYSTSSLQFKRITTITSSCRKQVCYNLGRFFSYKINKQHQFNDDHIFIIIWLSSCRISYFFRQLNNLTQSKFLKIAMSLLFFSKKNYESNPSLANCCQALNQGCTTYGPRSKCGPRKVLI